MVELTVRPIRMFGVRRPIQPNAFGNLKQADELHNRIWQELEVFAQRLAASSKFAAAFGGTKRH